MILAATVWQKYDSYLQYPAWPSGQVRMNAGPGSQTPVLVLVLGTTAGNEDLRKSAAFYLRCSPV